MRLAERIRGERERGATLNGIAWLGSYWTEDLAAASPALKD